MEPGGSTAGTPPQAHIDAAAAAQAPDLTGRTLGDFLLLRRLGQGGMGQVYLAEQVSLKRQVALKLLRPELSSNETSLKRFKSEAENVARATHANIVQVYAIGEAEGFHYMALEYVEGRNLREHLEKKGPPDVLLGLSIIRQVAAALQRAGELGLIHRDIKPENILLTRKGEVKVADFGLSRVFAEDVQPLHLTQTGVTMGTPLYMSPEQVENRPVDPRTDIYSLGVTCYHMFAGQPPFRGNSPFEVALQHVHKEADPLGEIRPDLPADLVNLVQRMMAKKPEDRFQSAREILREAGRLRDVLVGLTSGVSLPPVSSGSGPIEAPERISTQTLLPYRPSPWPRRLGILLVLAAAAGGAWLGWHLRRQEPPGVPRPDDGDSAKALFSRQEREKDLQRRVQELLAAKPGSRLDRDAGCKDVMDLGLLYLKEFRLDEAECFFQELDQMGRDPAYRVIGKLGWSMTLAFRDKAQASNEAFLGVLERDKMDKLPLMNPLLRWKEYPPFREMMARALLHNKANAPADFPSRLETYLHPPAPVLRKG